MAGEETWTKRAVPYGNFTYWSVVCDSRYVAQSLAEEDCDQIIADHTALAEMTRLRDNWKASYEVQKRRAFALEAQLTAANDRAERYKAALEAGMKLVYNPPAGYWMKASAEWLAVAREALNPIPTSDTGEVQGV